MNTYQLTIDQVQTTSQFNITAETLKLDNTYKFPTDHPVEWVRVFSQHNIFCWELKRKGYDMQFYPRQGSSVMFFKTSKGAKKNLAKYYSDILPFFPNTNQG